MWERERWRDREIDKGGVKEREREMDGEISRDGQGKG